MRFSDALDRSMEDITPPPNLPVGNYIWSVTKHPETNEIADGRFEKLTFLMGCISACEDVDPEDLAEYGNVNGTLLRKDFLFSTAEEDATNFERALNNLKRFIEHCGGDVSSGNMKEALASIVNAQVMGELKHRPNPNDPEQVFQEIGRTAPV